MDIQNQSDIVIYEAKDGQLAIDVKLDNETVWLSQKQMAQLFNKDSDTIGIHIKHVYEEGEVSENSTTAKYSVVQKEGNRSVNRDINFYNLDVIISVGYRVKSKEGTQFRIWATQVLREHLVQGFTVNQKQLQHRGLVEFERAIALIKNVVAGAELTNDQSLGLLDVITKYASSWALLQKYDENKLIQPKSSNGLTVVLDYKEAKTAIAELKNQLSQTNETMGLFGNEREHMFEGAISNIYQTFAGEDLYPSIEAKAAHLLYFTIKDHPFSDGNKRIGSFLFILFLAKNNYLFNRNSERKFNDNALVALALLVAESDPKQKEIMILLIMNLIAGDF